MGHRKMMSPSEREYQTRRRQLRAQERETQRFALAFKLFQSDRQSDADEYLSKADSVSAISLAKMAPDPQIQNFRHVDISLSLDFYDMGSDHPVGHVESMTVPHGETSVYNFFVKGFNSPVERIEARIQCNGHTAKIILRERISLENKRRFWKGSLEKGAPTRLELLASLKIVQYDPGRSPYTHYGIVLNASVFKKISRPTWRELGEKS